MKRITTGPQPTTFNPDLIESENLRKAEKHLSKHN